MSNNVNKHNLKTNYSPLRYPGGKSKLTPFVSLLIKKTGVKKPIYIEPFAGGAGIALSLLFNGLVEEIVINDYDKAIYSVWRAILTETKKFIELMETTPISVDEWRKQKKIYMERNKKYSLELGFATFYLNRTNRSGILNAGPIGGYDQSGSYKIDARFNKEALIHNIKKISKHKSKIHLYNQDVRVFLQKYLEKYINRAFVYLDPPYYDKGEELYKNYLVPKDHKMICEKIKQLPCPWMLTYDDAAAIYQMYQGYNCKKYDLIYSVANSGKKSEIMFISELIDYPTNEEMKNHKISINLRDYE